jgi:hypothetical protein
LPSHYGLTPDRWVRVEMVEADIEIGFRLIELVESWPAAAGRLVADAEGVYADVLARLARLEPPVRANFEPLVAELRRAIDVA